MKTEFRITYKLYNSGLWHRDTKVHYGKLSKYINRKFMYLHSSIEGHKKWAVIKVKSVECCSSKQHIYITFVIVVTNKVEFNKKKLSRPSLQADMEYLDSLAENQVPANLQDITKEVEEYYHNQQKVYS